MKTNIFSVKEKKEKKIIIEEERIKNPFLLFFKRHKNFILLLFITLLICTVLASIGVAFSVFQGSNDYDITYIDGSETIDSNNDPEIDDEDVENELLGEIAREEGVVILVENFMSPMGDVIYYYTDGTTIVTNSNGKTYRVSPLKDNKYGVNRNGKIDSTATKILVESTTTTLADGTIITNYTDGSARVDLKNETIFVRDSNNILLDNGTSFNATKPSGVALATDVQRVNNQIFIPFSDKTSFVQKNNEKVIVNPNVMVTNNGNFIEYDRYNSFEALSEKKYKDGFTITHYENGSATITDSKGNIIYVKKSGDLLLKSKKLYEIIPNEYGFSRKTFNCSDGKKVTYFDNGAAIIIQKDGTRQYVEDNDEIIFDHRKNIISSPTVSEQISRRVTEDGEITFNFENGKSQVIKENGSSYIIETSKLTFKPLEEPDEEIPEEEDSGHSGVTPSPGEGIYISEAENKYNDFKNIEDTTFIIKNNNNKRKVLRITIQEVENYNRYNTSRLDPQFVKFQATVGDNYISASRLTDNTWVDSDGVLNYVIYDGTIAAKETQKVALSLYVDYAPLDNSYQNKGFIGTIKIYVEDDTVPNN